MNKFFFGFAAALTFLLSSHFSPLSAQYNPPPPPEQQNTGEPPSDQPGPPPDAGQPAPDDQSAPPPEQGAPDEGAPTDDSAGDVNFQTFYDNLSSQGDWVQTDNYGYVWQPNEDDADWRPYSAGHWVYTDEGWTWVAADSEPWGWATYHYGRWANLDGYGWVWVPGYTWAPAWVSWRYGGGYCGWAPLPPVTFVGIDFGGAGFGFHIGGDCDRAYGIGPGYYNFIRVGDIGERDYRRHYLDRNNNFTIINNTRNVTNIYVNDQRHAGRFSRVSVGGPNIATINAQSRTPVERAQLSRSNRVGNPSLNGNRLSVFAPRVNTTGGTSFRPSHVNGTVHNARMNTGANVSEPLQVTSRVHGPAANAAQISAAQNTHFSSNAQVATSGTHPSSTLTRPLTSYQPHETHRAAATGGNAPSVQPERASNPGTTVSHSNAFTGENGAEVRHSESNGANASFNHEAPQVQHSVTSPQAQVEHPTYHPEAQAQHEEVHPQVQQVQHEEVHPQVQEEHQDFHPEAQPEHQEEVHPQVQEHHEEVHPQENHQESHPQVEHHDAPAPPPQHASAPASGGGHPSGGNGNGNGNGKDKDDNNQHH